MTIRDLIFSGFSKNATKYIGLKTRLLIPLLLISTLLSAPAQAVVTSDFGPETFIRSTGAPIVETRTFSLPRLDGQHTIQIYNGGLEDDEYEYVSSSVIKLNGIQLFGPKDFNQHVSYLERDVVLGTTNQLTVELRGKPNGALIINISGSYPNLAPVINSNPERSVFEDSPYHYAVSVTYDEAQRANLTYQLLQAPSGMAIDPANGVLTWQPENADVGIHPVELQVINTEGLSDSQAFALTVINTNDAPVITSTAPLQATQDIAYRYALQAHDIDSGDLLSYALAQAPIGMTIDTTGLIQWIPDNAQIGPHTITVNVTDTSAATTAQTYVLTVANVNDAPVITSIAITTATEDTPYSYSVIASDPDAGDSLNYTLATAPAGMTIDGAGNINWTPTNAAVGNHAVTVSATDVSGLSDSQSFTITVTNVNDAPAITSAPITVATEDTQYNYSVIATDPDAGDSLSYTLATAPAGMTIDNTTGEITWLPTNAEVGAHNVTVSVMDGAGLSASQSFTITVANINDAPVITSTAITIATEDSQYSYSVIASDPDAGDSLSYALATAPAGMTIDGAGNISWTPANAQVGLHNVTVSVTDSGALSASQSFTIAVANINDAPVITSTAITTATEDSQYSYSVIASDPDAGESLSYALTTAPAGMTINASGLIEWHPGNAEVGSHPITVGVTDIAGATAQQSFSLTVTNVNDAPIITSQAPLTATQDTAYHYPVLAEDADIGDVLSYTLTQAPAGMQIDATGLIQWTPIYNQIDAHSITVIVSDASASAQQTFIVAVANVNDAPVITSSPITQVNEDQRYHYTLLVSDVDTADVISYSLITAPAGMTIDTNGSLQWVPDNSHVGAHPIIIEVSDTSGATDQQSFTLTVINVNDAPVITSIPITQILAQEAYYYDVNATDPDSANQLSYQLTSAPLGMSINATEGVITWQPGLEHVGSHSILISVDDGQGATATQAFTLQVALPANRPPVAQNIVITVNEDSVLQINLLAQDPEHDTLAYTLLSQPQNGLLSGIAPTLSYTPSSNYNGTDTFTYQANDGTQNSNLATVTITVTPVNDAPIATDQSHTVIEDQTTPITLNAHDPDGDVLSYQLTRSPNHGAISGTLPDIHYTPSANYHGSDHFEYLASDGQVDVISTVTLNILAVNDPPHIVSQPPLTAVVDQLYQYQLNAQDQDLLDTLSYQLVTAPLFLSLSAEGLLQGQPAASDLGEHEITLTVSDNQHTQQQTFTLQVIALPETLPAYWGKEFWFVDDMQNTEQHANAKMMIYITSKEGAQGTIQAPQHTTTVALPSERPAVDFTVGPNEVIAIDYYHNFYSYSPLEHDMISGRGIHVSANQDIAVYVMFYYPATTDAIALLPTHSLGQEYRLSGYRADTRYTDASAAYSVVATEDNTTLTLQPVNETLRADGAPVPANSPYQVTLQRGQVYTFHSLALIRDAQSNRMTIEQTGSRLSATAPVGLFVTHICTQVPIGTRYCDQLSEQLPPISHWGHRYALVPNLTRYADLVRVVADHDDTQLTINGQHRRTLNQGEFWQFTLREAQWLEANKPILVTQLAASDQFDEVERSADEKFFLTRKMGISSDIERDSVNYLNHYQVTIDPSTGNSSVIVIMPDDALARLTVNGAAIPAENFTKAVCGSCSYAIEELPYAIAQIALTPGTHQLSSDVAFGVYENINGLHHFADPYLSVVAPVELAQDHYIFTTPTALYARHFINLALPEHAIDTVILDGQPVDPGYFKTVGNSQYAYARLAINPGRHEIIASEAFSLLVYGYDFNDSYGYIGGFGAPSLAPAAHLSLSVNTLNPAAGEPLCSAIQVTDAAGQPLNDMAVNIQLSGTHNEQQTRFTERNGQLEYCFNGYYPGQDQLHVTLQQLSQSLTITWQPAQGVNKAPVITSVPVVYLETGDHYLYNLIAVDPEVDELNYYLVNAPADMHINPASGEIGWRAIAGQYDIIVEVADSAGNIAQQAYQLTVNTLPVILQTPLDYFNNVSNYRSSFVVEDADGDDIYYQLLAADSQFNLSYITGSLSTGRTPEAGIYPITVRISDSQGGIIDVNMVITVVGNGEPPTPPTFPDVYVPSMAKVGVEYRFTLPVENPAGLPLRYFLVNPPQGASIDDNGTISWIPVAAGSYTLIERIYDGAGLADFSWNVDVAPADTPLQATIHLWPLQYLDAGELLTATVVPTGAASALEVQLTLDGQPLTLDKHFQTEIVAQGIGIHHLTAQLSDGDSQTSVQQTFYVRDPSDTEAPEVNIHTPANGGTMTAPLTVTGDVNDTHLISWRLVLQSASDRDPFGGQQLSSGTENGPVSATIDPILFSNGLYNLRLEGTDLNGVTASVTHSLTIDGNLKVGNFSFSVQDLSLPVVGMPVTVTRSYDTHRKAQGLDFGYGWSIDYQDLRLEESIEPTQGWYQFATRQLFDTDGGAVVLRGTCTYPKGSKRVTVTLPNGQIEAFTVGARAIDGGISARDNPDCNLLAGHYFSLAFIPEEGTESTLTLSGDNSFYLSNPEDGNLVIDITRDTPAQVSEYTLTTRHGYIYELDQVFGIRHITDPNGNTVTYSDSGILHSSGASITFDRDSEGRITTITDPLGNTLGYQYDSAGDLISATDQSGAITTYQYNQQHGLVTINDPLGRPVLKNIYDDNGRLIAQEDNQGNRSNFNHNIEGRLSLVTDRLGRTTQHYYDDRGNILTTLDALGHATDYSYDSKDNQLSKTDPLGHTTHATYNTEDDQLTHTDALGNTVTFVYNDKGQETRIVDARGNIFNNAYDATGNLLSITDPQGHTATQTLNLKGEVITTQDALGHTTHHEYDNQGNLITETNALGHQTHYTYDANNNKLSETRQRTIGSTLATEITRYSYDARNRLISTTDAAGNTQRIEYHLSGQESARIDALGRRTEFEYDVYNRLTQTRYPDGTEQTKQYDLEGNLTQQTNRAGHTTRYTYDALNRQTQVSYPDGSSSQTEYDAIGRITAEIEANGNRSTFTYDDAGRRTAVIDPLGHTTHYSYDQDGNLISQTDANGHTTSHTYDSLDRRSQTTYADGTTTHTEYDPLGRVIAEIDEAGIRREFAYDAQGQLLQVRQGTHVNGTTTATQNGATTHYSYDEAGNQISQTDALGRTTTWRYHYDGQISSRSTPRGVSERFYFDRAGNITSHQQFNNWLSEYTYDLNNRATLTNYQHGPQQSTQYDALGNRISTSHTEDGTTRIQQWQYDSRNRLTQETKATGDTLSYQYDSIGNRTQLTTRIGTTEQTTDYHYDALNRLQTVTGQASYSYDANGNPSTVTYPNGHTSNYHHNSRNRLIELSTTDATGNVIQHHTYHYASTGQRISSQEANGRISHYRYDDLYRLIEERITDPQNGDYLAQYSYDAVGNRTQQTLNGITTAYTYDEDDRLRQQDSNSFGYDNNGNRTFSLIDGVSTSYRYNRKNQLISTSGPSPVEYRYDVDGHRISKTVAGSQTDYLVDTNRDYAQVLAESANNLLNVTYSYGNDLISQDRNNQLSYYIYDAHGSTRALSDSLGNITDTYDYTAYGEMANQTGSTENSYLYSGEQFDRALGNYYLRARYYDQNVGRFTQMDRWQGNPRNPITLNKYAYANSDPINGIDPSGYATIGELGAGLGTGLTWGLTVSIGAFNFANNIAVGDGFSGRQLGWLTLINMGAAPSLAKLVLKKEIDENAARSAGKSRALTDVSISESDFGFRRAIIGETQRRVNAAAIYYEAITIRFDSPYNYAGNLKPHEVALSMAYNFGWVMGLRAMDFDIYDIGIDRNRVGPVSGWYLLEQTAVKGYYKHRHVSWP